MLLVLSRHAVLVGVGAPLLSDELPVWVRRVLRAADSSEEDREERLALENPAVGTSAERTGGGGMSVHTV